MVQFRVEPEPEPTRAFGPVANTSHTQRTSKCASTQALAIPREKLRRPSPSVIIVASLEAASVTILAVYPPFVYKGR